MSIHYKFKSAIDYDTITFDGLHISVSDLKKSIVHQKRLGKATDFDLMITNAQTNEGEGLFKNILLMAVVCFGFLYCCFFSSAVYTDESSLIPKNTSLIVARVPVAGATNKKIWYVRHSELSQSV